MPTLVCPFPVQSPVIGMSPAMPPNGKARSGGLSNRSLPFASNTQKKPLRKTPTLNFGPYCVIVTVWPATVTLPVRSGPVFFSRVKVTDPLPVVPEAPVTVAQGRDELEVQLHPAVVVTETVTVVCPGCEPGGGIKTAAAGAGVDTL